MDFLLSPNFIKFEVLFILINVAYILFHVLHWFISFLLNFWKRKPIPQKDEPLAVSVVIENQANENKIAIEDILEDEENEELSNKEKDKLLDIVRVSKTKFSMWDIEWTKASIIEWLSLDKDNRELNMLLALIYEDEKDYKKAELIYKDLMLVYDNDIDIHKKLGFVLSLQWRYEIAHKIYTKAFELNDSDQDILEMLSNLSFHVWLYEEAKFYSKLFLKNKPRNTEILTVLAYSQIKLEEREEALEILKKIKDMDPYNQEIEDIIEKLKTEMELSKNFIVPEDTENQEENI